MAVGEVRLFTDVELSTARTSATVHIDMQKLVGIHLWWTGTGSPVGTLSVNVGNDGTMTQVVSYDTQAVSGAGNWFVDVWYTGAGFLNVTYASTSGGTGSAINGIALVK